jgi:hypothetical protein
MTKEGLLNIASQSYVIIQGFEIRNYSTTKRNIVPVGVYISGAGKWPVPMLQASLFSSA